MKFRNKILDIFKGQFPQLVDKLEEELYFYLEELLLQQDLSLDEEIDYRNPDFRTKLHSMVDSLANGLSMLGVSKKLIEQKFKSNYRYFKTEKSLKTYKDWLYEEFSLSLNNLLFNEILSYFIEDSENIVDNLIQLGLIDDSIKTKLDKINKKYSRLSKFLSVPVIVRENLLNSIFKEGALKQLFKFETPFADLRALFFIYVLSDIYGLEHRINLSPSVQFLVGEVEKWSSNMDDVSLLMPLTLYCGLYLTKGVDIDIDTSICKSSLKDMIVNAVQQQADPIFQNPYLIYFIVKSMKLLKLKLTPKFLDGLVAKTEESTKLDSIRKLSTDQLATISTLYQELGFKPKLDSQDRENFIKVFKEREQEGIYCLTQDSTKCTVESIWGSLDYFIDNKGVDQIDFGKCLEFLINELIRISDNLTATQPEMLGSLVLGLEILDKIDKHFETALITQLERYIFNEVKSIEKQVPKAIIDDLISDANKPQYEIKEVDTDGQHEVMSDMDDMDADFEDELDKLTNLEAPSLSDSDRSALGDLGISEDDSGRDEDFENLMNEDLEPVAIDRVKKEEKETKRAEVVEPLPNRPIDIANYLVDPPNLSLKFIKNLDVSYNSVTKPPVLVKEDLRTLYHLVAIEHMLRLKHNFSAQEIHEVCQKYYQKTGFGATRFPDVEYTYYGLYIYHEYDIMDRIDIYKIHEYLLEEIERFKDFNLSNNRYLFSCLKILEKHEIPMAEYSRIIVKMLDSDYLNTDDFDPLIESYEYAAALKLLAPKNDISSVKKRFQNALHDAIGLDGSINDTVTDTAKVLITTGLFDLFDSEIEATNKMVNYLISKCEVFSESVRDQHISWGGDILGLSVECNIAYWCLMALLCYRPVKSDDLHPNICGDCGNYFPEKPKFCNMCGNKFT